MDIPGIYFGRGPLQRIAAAPQAGIGFVEAHGLALILGVMLWRTERSSFWNVTAAAVHTLLGSANLLFWRYFVTSDALAAGYVTTALHWLFVVLLLAAQLSRKPAFDNSDGPA